MDKYNVSIFSTVILRVFSVEAGNMEDAVKNAHEFVDVDKYFDREYCVQVSRDIKGLSCELPHTHVEYSGLVKGFDYVVDVQGDTGYEKSKYFSDGVDLPQYVGKEGE